MILFKPKPYSDISSLYAKLSFKLYLFVNNFWTLWSSKWIFSVKTTVSILSNIELNTIMKVKVKKNSSKILPSAWYEQKLAIASPVDNYLLLLQWSRWPVVWFQEMTSFPSFHFSLNGVFFSDDFLDNKKHYICDN